MSVCVFFKSEKILSTETKLPSFTVELLILQSCVVFVQTSVNDRRAETETREIHHTLVSVPTLMSMPSFTKYETTLPRRCLKTRLGRSFYSFQFRDLFFVCFSFGFTSVQCSKSLKSSGYNFLVESSVLFSHSSAHCSHWRKASQGQILLTQHILWRETQRVSRAATCRKYSE